MFRSKVVGTKKIKLPPEGLLCNYSQRLCTQNRLDGYEYCIRHILEDKSAPYKQCNYFYPKNGKRCPNPTPKLEKKDGVYAGALKTSKEITFKICPEHTRKAILLRQRLTRKRKPVETTEKLLEDLEQYVVYEEHKDELLRSAEGGQADILGQKLSSSGNMYASKGQPEYLSDSESEKEVPLVDQAWPGDAESEAESVDSEVEDPLKHAGVFTAEEVAIITRDKLIRLQSLYIEQFKRLQHILRERRRKYFQTLKAEKETMGSIHSTPRPTPEEVRYYDRLKALNRYHRRHGRELLLHLQAKEKRVAATDGIIHKSPSYQRCIHPCSGERCNEKVLPLSKYCPKHILYDPHQVLFRPCNAANFSCKRPIVPAIDGPTCLLHATLPGFPSLISKRAEEEAARAAENHDTAGVAIKTEACVDDLASMMEQAASDIARNQSWDEPNMKELCQEISEIEMPSELVPEEDDTVLALEAPSPETEVEK